jgi:hypothetical protein
MARPGWHLLLCGPTHTWPVDESTNISQQYAGLVTVHHLSATDAPGVLHDSGGLALRRLGLAPGHTALYLVRPDGHVGYRSGGGNLTGLADYVWRWLPASGGGGRV